MRASINNLSLTSSMGIDPANNKKEDLLLKEAESNLLKIGNKLY